MRYGSSGDLTERLPLCNPLQHGGPLGRWYFEEGNRWIYMLLLRQRQGYAACAQLRSK